MGWSLRRAGPQALEPGGAGQGCTWALIPWGYSYPPPELDSSIKWVEKPPVQPQGLVEIVSVNKNAHCSAGYLLSEVAVAFIRMLTYPSRILGQLTQQQFQSRPKSWGK